MNYDPNFTELHSRERIYDTHAYTTVRHARVYMNKDSSYNMFTKSYADQVNRILSSMEYIGEDIRYIHFLSKDPTIFSKGTDFKTLDYYRNHGNMDGIVDYLNSLFNLQINYAKNNKPILLTASGIVENSAIGMVGSAGISCITKDSELVFNECTKRNKVIPHAGSSYFLTRMDGEIGTFLALTNTVFTGSEAIELLGIADYCLTTSVKLMEELSRVGHLRDSRIDAFHLHGMNDGFKDFREEQKRMHKHDQDLFNWKHRRVVDKKFIPPWEAKENERQEASDRVDVKYKEFLRDNAYSKFLYDKLKLGSGHTGHYINHYKYHADHLKSLLDLEETSLRGSIVRRYEKDINRCFWPDSIEEIIENLKKENTRFAKY